MANIISKIPRTVADVTVLPPNIALHRMRLKQAG
jgi:hypothetical protein